MVKKRILTVVSLAFAFAVLGISMIRTSAQANSKNYKVLALTPKSTSTPTPEAKKIDYFLAYPGILPNHFLYPVKMFRDKVMVFLTSSSLKRGELFLLFADKRIGAAKALIDGGRPEMGVSTATKAEKYLEQALTQEKIAREKGIDTRAFLEKLSGACLKHEEMILEMAGKVSGPGKGALEKALEYPRTGLAQIRAILEQQQ